MHENFENLHPSMDWSIKLRSRQLCTWFVHMLLMVWSAFMFIHS